MYFLPHPLFPLRDSLIALIIKICCKAHLVDWSLIVTLLNARMIYRWSLFYLPTWYISITPLVKHISPYPTLSLHIPLGLMGAWNPCLGIQSTFSWALDTYLGAGCLGSREEPLFWGPSKISLPKHIPYSNPTNPSIFNPFQLINDLKNSQLPIKTSTTTINIFNCIQLFIFPNFHLKDRVCHNSTHIITFNT